MKTVARIRRRISVTSGVALLTVILTPGVHATARPTEHLPTWRNAATAGPATYRALAAVNRRVAWLGSDDGTVLRTADGGRSWLDVSPPAVSGLHFRDLHAFDASTVIAMTAGAGSDSRLYRTSDGGGSWDLVHQAGDPSAFFDAMAFLDERNGLVFSDPIDGKFQIFATRDAGRTWSLLPGTGMPPALPGEFGFADSGTSMAAAGRDVWFGTGSGATRVFHSSDRGLTWDVSSTPVLTGDTAGIYGLAFRNANLGLAVGGDFATPDITEHVSATTWHGGPWTTPAREPSGVRFAASWIPGARHTVVAVGINGSDVSDDDGQHWTRFSGDGFNTIDCAVDATCWAAGDSGRVATLRP